MMGLERNLLLALGLVGAVLVACGGDDASSAAVTVDDGDAGDTDPYTGPAKTGLIALPDAGVGDFQPSNDLGDAGLQPFDAGPACCTISFALADSTNTETTARLRGDFGPLAGDGIALTWTAGQWTAQACIPTSSFVHYWYYFGQVPENQAEGSGALVDDDRVDAVSPTTDDGNGGRVNTLDLGTSCPP